MYQVICFDFGPAIGTKGTFVSVKLLYNTSSESTPTAGAAQCLSVDIVLSIDAKEENADI